MLLCNVTVRLCLPESSMLVGTSTNPVASSYVYSATTSSLSVMIMVPLVIGSPVVLSVAFTRTVTFPAVLFTNVAFILLSRPSTSIVTGTLLDV